jgi:hypothetical protein
MATTDLSLTQLCLQRKKQLLFNFPINRYNPVSPYVGHITSAQLDMRRKAEILQYNASKSNTKTNNYTKAEKWSLLINGKNQKNTYNNIKISQVQYEPSNIGGDVYSDDIVINNQDKYSLIPVYTDIIVKYPDTYTTSTDINGNITHNIIHGIINGCNTDMIPVPTTSSDVPGPPINLIRDVTIPLYNYNNPITYGIQNTETNDKYNYIIENNILFNNNIENKLFSLNIINNNDNYSNKFGFDVPISISFQNNTTANLSNDLISKFNNITINLSNIVLNVYYNNSAVYSRTLVPNVPNIDISLNSSSNNTLNNKITTSFSGSIYIGILNIRNVLLYTQPGYVYDIKLTCKMNDNINNIINDNPLLAEYSNQISINKSIIFNNTDSNIINSNCTINTQVSNTPNNGFILYGY